MKTSDNSNNTADEAPKKHKKRSNSLLKFIGRTILTLFALILLVIALIAGTVAYLTSDRLTPLVKEQAGRFINADVDLARIELSFWSTFPRLNLEIDSLTVISHALDKISPELRAALPTCADTLASLDHFSGGINLTSLLRGIIHLHDIEINNPRVNLVKADSVATNYDIALSKSESDSSPAFIPQILLNRFALTGKTPVRYFSLPDSIDLCVTLSTTSLEGSDAPLYKIDIEGDGRGRVADLVHLTGIPFGINGAVRWRIDDPMKIDFEDFTLYVDNTRMKFDARVDLTESPMVDGVKIEVPDLKLAELLATLPKIGMEEIRGFESDLSLTLKASLPHPYRVAEGGIPAMDVEIDIPEGTLTYDRLRLNRFAAKLKGSIPAEGLDRATLTVERLLAVGRGVGFEFKGTVSGGGNISNPLIAGHFEGGVSFNRLPRQLMAKLPVSIAGLLTGKADFRFKPSMFTPENFHRFKVDGTLRLKDFAMAARDSSMRASSPLANLRFGSGSKVKFGDIRVDSLLTVALTVDSVSYESAGVRFTGSELAASLGARNTAETKDTTLIVPIGMRVAGKRLNLISDADSTRLRLRNLEIRGSIRRYLNNARRPLANLQITSKSMRFVDPLNRLNLRGVDLALTLHPRQRPQLSKRGLAIFDSISAATPNLSVDSAYAMTQRELSRLRAERRRLHSDSLHRNGAADSTARRKAHAAYSARSEADIDFEIDKSLKTWLRLWEASGHIKAKRGRAFTPYFPVRNILDSLDIDFSTDTVTVNHARYRSGRTSIRLDGSIANIAGALTSRRSTPIDISLNLDCDTLDINSFAEAAFAGSAFATRKDSIHVKIADTDNDEEIQRSVEAAAPPRKVAFVVPSNVNARLSLKAKEVLYADIWFQRLKGIVEMSNGAIHLDRLGAFTDMGTLDMTMLYSAPDLHNIDFAGGIVVRKLDLKKFLHMMPQVDSLLPLLRQIEGIVTADMAMTTELDSVMDFKFNTLKAAMKLEGDSLVLIDQKTFDKVSKWLLFRHKNRNMIDHMSVEMLIDNSYLQLMPFVFDFDRYKLGVWGGNDIDMNFDYHVAVLKSPLPFKFGVTLKGHGSDFKVKLGKANFDPDKIVREQRLTDTTRINLISEIKKVFSFGVSSGKRNRKITLSTQGSVNPSATEYSVGDTFTHADSVLFMQEGVIEMTSAVADSIARANEPKGKLRKEKRKKKKDK